VSAVRYFLLNSNVDITFLDKSHIIKATRSGILNHYHATHPVAEDRTLLLSCDMLIYAINHIYNTGSPQYECIIAALITARVRILRSCEVIELSNQTDHVIRAYDIVFEFEGHCTIQQKISSDVTLDLRPHLARVNINLRDRKNDTHGSGHNCTFDFNCVSTQGFNIVSVLFNWSVRAQLRHSDPFFSYRQCWKLSYSTFNSAHKRIAKTMGIDPTNFSTHSSRIGGACTLAAAGFPDSFVMLAGGWCSLAFLYYIRLAIAQYQRGL